MNCTYIKHIRVRISLYSIDDKAATWRP